ncbi:hypothetical protein AV530_001862 [Patagioenas fasciata monilis]|uniref:Uncharacterized protein n=1 Tax=Patagioenas fasciata monilis TaxID=372326 RepID=A0A1V4J5X8_PATFA|nr:hypothetical protein AV530_001862 [Patagioenas fasciata monilis]
MRVPGPDGSWAPPFLPLVCSIGRATVFRLTTAHRTTLPARNPLSSAVPDVYFTWRNGGRRKRLLVNDVCEGLRLPSALQ